jgi:hypothetical protein
VTLLMFSNESPDRPEGPLRVQGRRPSSNRCLALQRDGTSHERPVTEGPAHPPRLPFRVSCHMCGSVRGVT